MQINAIFATLFAASASGAAIKSRYATGFTVTNFSASCIPHSVMCSYEFYTITDPETASPSGNPTPAKCSLMLQGPDVLPTVGWTGCAEKGAYSWAVDKFEDGLKLRVTTPQDSHGNYTGVYEITTDQLVMEQHGASISQRYTGPAEFTMALGV
ncbi:uncharacterized protein F4812DRAFT_427497 [Daldinia caldariorum]|uniref:uncharacterized protein n=1 Tax=Daldinia caldariorum TaxID=326644 RepID=UPI0020073714|nr:uncharacterized protein F4812DRAFT_427497 [Daldinia caldariorum]KAI1467764.1 hypothetical protein F4812DRAFT_427497 [Daldinia caldariorum]